MPKIVHCLTCAATAGLAAAVIASSPASAKQVCGWYAIAFCSPSQAAASQFANGGWGQVIDTRQYAGLKPGLACVVSGPQPKASAVRDRTAAISNGVSASTYIKRACTDEKNVGD